MPIRFAGAGFRVEHLAVENAAGVYDVSHMARILIIGPDATRFLSLVCTRNIRRLLHANGLACYSLFCDENGRIRDDVFVFRLSSRRFLLVANAANADVVWRQLNQRVSGFRVRLENVHESTAMIAVQGPQAATVLCQIMDPAFVNSLLPRRCGEITWQRGGVGRRWRLIVSRTGYTRKGGFEIVINRHGALDLARALLETGVQFCGLEARETQRLAAALPLYGNDIGPDIDPWEAGLGWAVDLDHPFIGREALIRIKKERGRAPGGKRRLVCLRVHGGRPVRAGDLILFGEVEIGEITSGGPCLTPGWEEYSIGMGYVPLLLSNTAMIQVKVRGDDRLDAEIVPRNDFVGSN